ncbi:MAG: alcohol dehydrogenase, partial [Streptococcaceae bacterium]|nr:alcohol dehydrogenase [Streptococcaceae bacterium]
MKALVFDDFGSSDVLTYREIPRPERQAGEVLVKTEFIGLNFADIYRRRGGYHIEPHRPYINGYEASGVISEAKNPDWIGRKVLFVDCPLANAEYVAVPEEKLIFLPAKIELKLAATIGLQGLTADFLAHDLGKNEAGEKVFVTGISGGVGQILAQMLLADGLEVSGSASADKAHIALDFGAKEVLPSRDLSWLTDYAGQFDSVYDGIGSTLNASISLIKNR